MRKILVKRIQILCRAIFIVIVAKGYWSCAERINRPSAVPANAVYVPLVKNACWQLCDLLPKQNAAACTIYSKDGHVIKEGRFVPYYPFPETKEYVMNISPKSKLPLFQLVWLEDGNVLMPIDDERWARENIEDVIDKQ